MDALIEAHRCEGIHCVLVRSVEQQQIQQLHRLREQWKKTRTALVAAGTPNHFRSGRYFAAWLGLTPSEFSSGTRRYLGRMSKQGDAYLRTLLIHGARSVLIHARSRHNAGQPLNRLQRWAVQLHARVGHNKAAVGVANKLARIAWATWKHGRDYDGDFALKCAA